MGKGDETRSMILERAVDCASVDGLEGLSIGGLASDLGLSKSGLYAHFRSKEALQCAVLQASERDFVNRVVRPALTTPRGEPRIRAIISHWLDWALHTGPQGGCVFVAASVEYDDKPGPVQELVRTLQTRWVETLARAAQLAVDAGHFRADLDCRQFAFELQSLMLGSHMFLRLLQDPDTLTRNWAAVERILAWARA